jgi:hypothetical protein
MISVNYLILKTFWSVLGACGVLYTEHSTDAYD